jgi:hypothetical protein
MKSGLQKSVRRQQVAAARACCDALAKQDLGQVRRLRVRYLQQRRLCCQSNNLALILMISVAAPLAYHNA